MEFLPALASDPSMSTSPGRVRIALFLRPRDISNRYSKDYHLIVATMKSEITEVSHIRMKVLVKHRDAINNLDKFKTREDSFYFHQVR